MGAVLAVAALVTPMIGYIVGSSHAANKNKDKDHDKRWIQDDEFAVADVGMDGKTTVAVMSGLRTEPLNPGISMYALEDPLQDFWAGRELDLFPLRKGNAYAHTFAQSDTPRYIYVTNTGPEPFCLAGVSIKHPSGEVVTLSGTLGRVCGVEHYESQFQVVEEDKSPGCTWVDRTGSAIRLSGLTFDLSLGDGKTPHNITAPEDLCKEPYVTTTKPVEEAVKRRQVGDVDSTSDFESQLVKSNLTTSSAVRLCEGKFSIGPHLASLSEKLYCDMATRELYPICEPDTTGTICFDAEIDELVERESEDAETDEQEDIETSERGDNGSLNRRAAHVVKGRKNVKVIKSFRRVEVWA